MRLVNLLFGSRGGPSTNDFDTLSWAARKTAHLLAYSALAVLATRALNGLFPNYSGVATRRGSWETFWKTAVVVLPFGAVVAAVDEFHQSFVASRTASPWGALIDVLGLVLGRWDGRRPARSALCPVGPRSRRYRLGSTMCS